MRIVKRKINTIHITGDKMFEDFINLIGLYIPYDYIVRVSVVAFLVYFVPTIIVFSRGHRNEMSIVLLNILLGWTIIGWVASLIWACTGERSELALRPGPTRKKSTPIL